MLNLIGSAVTAVAVTAAATAGPATVKSGVEHWRAGEYQAAVAAWLPFAAQGDADASFNMGQAYKLGRGVAKDPSVARDYYRRAAAKGHLPAQANLGIALFQAGDKLEAVRWLKQAADRGEPRAQYVLGIAAYNGDGTPKNSGLAYGYLLRAQASGLPQATTALASIEPALAPDARSAGSAMAASLAAGTGVPAALAAASVPRTAPAGVQRPGQAPPPSLAANVVNNVRSAFGFPPKPPVQTADATLRPAPKPSVPQPVPVAKPAVSKPAPVPVQQADATPPASKPVVTTPPPARPTTAAASIGPANPNEEAPPAAKPAAPSAAAAATVTPTSVAAPATKQAAPDTAPVKAAEAKPAPAPAKVADAKPVPPKPAGWRVQLGAFSSQKQADAAWASVKTAQAGAIGKAKPIFESSGPVVKFQLGPYATRDAARDTCAKLAFAGKACFVTQG